MFDVLFKLEDRFPRLFVKLFKFPIIVLTPHVRTAGTSSTAAAEPERSTL